MKIFVPYTKILPATEMVLMPYDYEKVFMPEPDSYYYYFKQRWEDGESFINCEQDSVFWPGAIEDLEKCPEPWCAFGTVNDLEVPGVQIELQESFAEGANPSLALVKFDAKFMKKYPHIWDTIEPPEPSPNWDNVESFRYCDCWLYKQATYINGVICHQHYPSIVNANPTKTVVVVNL